MWRETLPQQTYYAWGGPQSVNFETDGVSYYAMRYTILTWDLTKKVWNIRNLTWLIPPNGIPQ